MITGMRKLRALGYRRIGMVTSHEFNERMDRMWTAAYQAELPGLPESQTLPICFLDLNARTGKAAGGDKEQVLDWYRRYKPEAIITPSTPVFEWLTESGCNVPEDVAVVSLSLHREGLVSGIVEASRETGRAAANFLAGMLQRGEYGVPSIAQRVLLEGGWFAGTTILPGGPDASVAAQTGKTASRRRSVAAV